MVKKLKFYIVYKITNQINGKFYIGVHATSDVNDGYMGSGKYLKRAQNKHGIENFTKEILLLAYFKEKNMNRRINNTSPFDMLDLLASSMIGSEFIKVPGYNYPPHNVVQISDDHIQIQISVAGFKKSDLSIKEVDSVLIVSGSKKETSEITYLFKGLASRSFELKWKLPADMEVGITELVNGEMVKKSASLDDGILTIDLVRVENSNKVKSYDIT